MALIGKGRGWARAGEHETVLRRPGQSDSPKTSEFDKFVDKIYQLEIDTTPPDCLNEIIAFAQSYVEHLSTEDMDKLWKRILEDRCFCIKYAIFNKVVRPKIEPRPSDLIKFNFTTMQTYYEKREELQKENPFHLTNLTWILGAFISDSTSLSMIRALGTALFDCCCLLLETATEDDVETVVVQLYINGRAIVNSSEASTEAVETSFSKVVNKARQVLVNRNVSARTRALLLLIIELSKQQFQPLTDDLQNFYTTALEPTYTPEVDPRYPKNRDFNQQSYLYNLLSKKENDPVAAVQELSIKNSPPQQSTKKVNKNKGPAVPTLRAIRGSGASDRAKEDHRNDKKSPRGHKEKLTDKQVWSAKQNTGSKVWGHDDRFDNDYE